MCSGARRDRRTRIRRGCRQVWLPDLDRVDRCTSCHLGIATPERRDAPQPFRAHPGRWLETHRPDRYGCTACHGGQGEATTFRGAAHQAIPDWPEPMASRELMEARCGTCHKERRPKGTDWLDRGRALMADRNCVACHEVPGHDLAEVRTPAPRRPAAQGVARLAAGMAEEAEELPAEVADGGFPLVGARRRGADGVPAAAAPLAPARPGRLVEGRCREGRGGLPRVAVRDLPRGERPGGLLRPGPHPRRGQGLARVALLLDPRPAPLPAEDAHAALPLHRRAGPGSRGLPVLRVRRAARGLRDERRAAFRRARGGGPLGLREARLLLLPRARGLPGAGAHRPEARGDRRPRPGAGLRSSRAGSGPRCPTGSSRR